MLWSPERIAGHKRSLATREIAGVESKTESGEIRMGEEEESKDEEDEEDWDSGEKKEPDQEGIDIDNMRPTVEAT